MPTATTTYAPDSVTSVTPYSGAAGAGTDLSGFGDLLNQAAKRRAFIEERDRQDRLQREEYDRKMRERELADREHAVTASHEQANAPQRAIEGPAPNTDVHWLKDFGYGKFGMDMGGPVEVAPGTFGAYRASTGADAGAMARAKDLGLTPGLAGQRLGGTNMLLGEGGPDEEAGGYAVNSASQIAADRMAGRDRS